MSTAWRVAGLVASIAGAGDGGTGAVECRRGPPRAASLCVLLLCAACSPNGGGPELALPERPDGAAGGAEIAHAVRTVDLASREERIYSEVVRGNVPGWLRTLQRVVVEGEVNGRRRTVTFWTTPDYLAVGSDTDYLLFPLSAQTAQRIADRAGASLPTPRMVDAIWTAADVRVNPIRLALDEHRGTVRYFERHDNLVKAQRTMHNAPPGEFVAGHKLDVVLTPTVRMHPARGSHYGWHRTSGEPIQPLYTAVSDSVVIFSHGIRLVHRSVLVDGEAADLRAVLADPALAPLLSDQGVISQGPDGAMR